MIDTQSHQQGKRVGLFPTHGQDCMFVFLLKLSSVLQKGAEFSHVEFLIAERNTPGTDMQNQEKLLQWEIS